MNPKDKHADWLLKPTANELADKLEKCCLVSWGECTHEDYDTDIWTKTKSATMLRQQQAELDRAVELYTDKAIENEALEKEVKHWQDAFHKGVRT